MAQSQSADPDPQAWRAVSKRLSASDQKAPTENLSGACVGVCAPDYGIGSLLMMCCTYWIVSGIGGMPPLCSTRAGPAL